MIKRSLNPIKAQHFLDLLRPRGGGQICPQSFFLKSWSEWLAKNGPVEVSQSHSSRDMAVWKRGFFPWLKTTGANLPPAPGSNRVDMRYSAKKIMKKLSAQRKYILWLLDWGLGGVPWGGARLIYWGKHCSVDTHDHVQATLWVSQYLQQYLQHCGWKIISSPWQEVKQRVVYMQSVRDNNNLIDRGRRVPISRYSYIHWSAISQEICS